MNNTKEHQKLVDDVLYAVGSLPYARCWPQINGLFRDLHCDRFIKVGINGMGDIAGILIKTRQLYGNINCEFGIHMEIECKTGGGKLSPDQIKRKTMVEKFGGIYIQARNVDNVLTEIEKYR